MKNTEKPKTSPTRLQRQALINELIGYIIPQIVHSTADDLITGNADEEAIRSACREAASTILNNEPLDDKLKKYIFDTLFKVSQGMSPDLAFGIKHGSKRRALHKEERMITLKVFLSMAFDDHSLTRAIKIIAKTDHKAESTISKIYYKHIDIIKNLTIEYIQKNKSI